MFQETHKLLNPTEVSIKEILTKRVELTQRISIFDVQTVKGHASEPYLHNQKAYRA